MKIITFGTLDLLPAYFYNVPGKCCDTTLGITEIPTKIYGVLIYKLN